MAETKSVWDELKAEAERDDRVGRKEWTVTSVDPHTWPSGDTGIKIKGVLTGTGGASVDIVINDDLTEEQARELKASGSKEDKRRASENHTRVEQLQKHYGKTAAQVAVGDVMRVLTIKSAKKPQLDGTTKGGFIRIIAFLPPGEASGEAKSRADVPF